MPDIHDELALEQDEATSVRRVTKKTFSLMIGNYWLFISAVLIILSFLIHQMPLLMVAIVFFLTGSVSRIWDRYCLSRIEYRRKLSQERAFFGDEVTFEISVANRKPLPLPWFQIEEEIPSDLPLLAGNASPFLPGDETKISNSVTYGWYNRDNRANISNYITLSWYNRITRKYPLLCNRRGVFDFGPTLLRSGDIFGIFSREAHIRKLHHLTVYPKMVPLEELNIPSRQLFGDIRTSSHIFEDPIMTMGIRDYQFGDSLKKVHWRATARTRKLQTKVFEVTTTTDIALFLDTRTTQPSTFGHVPDLLELTIVVAASIANEALAAGFRTGFYANQQKRFPDEPMRVPPGQHADQMMHILDSLAQVTAFETMPITALLQRESRNLAWGSTILVVTAMLTDTLLGALYSMKRGGRKVVLVLVGGNKPDILPGNIMTYHVSESISWRDLDAVTLRGR